MAFVGDANRKLFRPEAFVAPVQELFAQELKLSSVIPVENIDAQVFNYLVQDPSKNLDLDEPEPMVLGGEFPDISFEELDDAKGIVGARGWKFGVSPQRLHYSQNTLTLLDMRQTSIERFARYFEKRAYDSLTNKGESTKGTQFDATLSEAVGGYATNGKHILIENDAEKAWNQSGDPVQQISDLVHVMENQGRIADLSGDLRVRASRSVAFIEPNAYHALHDDLRDQRLHVESGPLPDSITVPSLYGLTFAKSDFAFTDATGAAVNGEMIVMDRGQAAAVRYQSLPPLETTQGPYSPVTSGVGPDLLVKDLKMDNGGLEVRMFAQEQVVVRKPKAIVHYKGLWRS